MNKDGKALRNLATRGHGPTPHGSEEGFGEASRKVEVAVGDFACKSTARAANSTQRGQLP